MGPSITALPRMHLLSNIESLDANASISDAHYDSVLRVMRSFGKQRPDGVQEPDAQGLQVLGASHILGPGNYYPHANINLTRPTTLEDVSITPTDAPFPLSGACQPGMWHQSSPVRH